MSVGVRWPQNAFRKRCCFDEKHQLPHSGDERAGAAKYEKRRQMPFDGEPPGPTKVNEMKTIISGSRSLTDHTAVEAAIESCPWEITSVIVGGARGVDRIAEGWAWRKRLPITIMRADWRTYGLNAGTIRNSEMADVAQAVLAIWDGYSAVTAHMIEIARERGLRVHVVNIGTEVEKVP